MNFVGNCDFITWSEIVEMIISNWRCRVRRAWAVIFYISESSECFWEQAVLKSASESDLKKLPYNDFIDSISLVSIRQASQQESL